MTVRLPDFVSWRAAGVRNSCPPEEPGAGGKASEPGRARTGQVVSAKDLQRQCEGRGDPVSSDSKKWILCCPQVQNLEFHFCSLETAVRGGGHKWWCYRYLGSLARPPRILGQKLLDFLLKRVSE